MKQNALFSAQLPKDEDFERFWAIYPRKVAKAEARKAWEQTKSIRPPVERLMEAVRSHCRTKQWQQLELIPHASTWLRGERWGDQTGGTPVGVPDLEERSRRDKAEFAAGVRRILSDPNVARLHLTKMKDTLRRAAAARAEREAEREAIQAEGQVPRQ